jgi:hypothetical protein
MVGCDSGGGTPSGEEQSNEEPNVTISAPSQGSEFSKEETIVFAGSAEDPETGQLEGEDLQWSSVSDGRFGSGKSVSTSSLPPNLHTVILAATDSVGETGRDTVSVGVNGPPTASIEAPNDKSALMEGQPETFRGSGTDPVEGEVNQENLKWLSDVDGDLGTGKEVEVSSLSPGPHTILLTATDEDGKTDVDTANVVVEEPGFNVRFRFQSELTESQKRNVEQSAAAWEQAITEDLEPFFLGEELADATGIPEGGIDDLSIGVEVKDIDGPAGTLAQARPVTARTNSSGEYTSASSGFIQIDQADLNNTRLETILRHEIGHVLGIGVLWDQVNGQETVNPFHSGSSTKNAFESLDGSEAYLGEGVPLQRTGGQGTRGSHWAERNFENELMTGNLNSDRVNPISRITLSALEDIGYPVDIGSASRYSLPDVQTTFIPAEADATLSRPAQGTDNFGTPRGGSVDSVLVVGSNNDALWFPQAPEDEVFSGLIRFDLPDNLPAGVQTATLFALQSQEKNTETTGHDIEVYRVEEGWRESFTTADTRPAVGTKIQEFGFNSCDPACGDRYRFGVDVSSVVQNWLQGAANNGLYLRAPDAESNPTFSVGLSNRHVEGNVLRRPFLYLTASSRQTALRPKAGFEENSGLRQKAGSQGGISMENDILDRPVYGKGPSGEIRKKEIK